MTQAPAIDMDLHLYGRSVVVLDRRRIADAQAEADARHRALIGALSLRAYALTTTARQVL